MAAWARVGRETSVKAEGAQDPRLRPKSDARASLKKDAARNGGRRPSTARGRNAPPKGQSPDQTAILKDLATCSLIGSTASAIAFWVKAPMSLLWLVIVSTCLRAKSVCSAMTSVSDLAANTDFRKSKFASALARSASNALALMASAPSLAAAKLTSNAHAASSAWV